MPQDPVSPRPSNHVAEIHIRWQGDAILHTAHLNVGEYWTPPNELVGAFGEAGPPRIEMQAREAVIRLPDDDAQGHTDLMATPEEEQRVVCGPLEVLVTLRPQEAAAGVGLKALVAGFSFDSFKYIGGSLGFAGLMSLILSLAPPPSLVAASDMIHEQRRLLDCVTLADERTPPELTPTERADDSGASEAAPATDEAGTAGDRNSEPTQRRYAIRQREPNEPEALSRESLTDAATEQGTIGVLASMTQAWNTPSSPYGAVVPNGRDAMDAMGALMGDQAGQNFGFNGLTMRGTGRSGAPGARGTIGTEAYSTCGGCGGASSHSLERRSAVPRMTAGTASTRGGLGADMIRRVVRRNVGQVRHCYTQQLQSRPDLEGRVTVAFIIGPTGAVQGSSIAQSSVQNPPMEHCIANTVRRWTFPASPDGSVSSVRYPFTFQMR